MSASETSSSPYFLRSPRLGFRWWEAEDLDLALELWGDPEVTRLIDARGALSRADVEQRLASERAMEMEHGIQYWPMFLLSDGAFVGCCGLRPRHQPAGIYELGFHVCSHHWRHGYATEAARAVIDHAFDTLDATALFAGHHPENQPSRELLLELGFRHTHDELYPATDLEHPSYLLPRRMMCYQRF